MKEPFIVKVCGVTTREDAQAALDAGANALGFNFYPQSPRYLSFGQAEQIIQALRGDYLRVGVFVNPAEEVAMPFLDVAQIHGTGRMAMKTWRAVDAGALPAADDGVEAWLMDTCTPAFGGSGRTFDWSLASGFPYRCIVAGGLDGDNVAEAIRIAHPFGVDSCSRLESGPGRKDHAKVRAFVTNALHSFRAGISGKAGKPDRQ
jgi:phosphoribosylanthranilate isomerase